MTLKKLEKISIYCILFLFSSSLIAGALKYQYNADVKGMVCAFCAYSVSKNISKIKSIDADSVNVDLKAGKVSFESSALVSEKKISALFTDSGFTISDLRFTKINSNKKPLAQEVELSLSIDTFKLDQYGAIFEAIGNLVANSSAQIIIKAPAAQEESILKPLLMGRQQVVRLHFIENESETVLLQILK